MSFEVRKHPWGNRSEDRYFDFELDVKWQNKSLIAPEDRADSVSVQNAPSSN